MVIFKLVLLLLINCFVLSVGYWVGKRKSMNDLEITYSLGYERGKRVINQKMILNKLREND
ncbi:unnamed protein product [Fructobacillus tropaeoli]|uniref:hypothetical protein n=1 Tax=Fructobacillus tropaeoli TaxID=709323 RepID=UPI002D87FCCB|nr:unnamed protein product [Fructobacillus tropaeoli]